MASTVAGEFPVKLSSQEEYGLRCALNLARLGVQGDSGERNSITIAQISATEGLSTEYAGKLLGILSKSGPPCVLILK